MRGRARAGARMARKRAADRARQKRRYIGPSSKRASAQARKGGEREGMAKVNLHPRWATTVEMWDVCGSAQGRCGTYTKVVFVLLFSLQNRWPSPPPSHTQQGRHGLANLETSRVPTFLTATLVSFFLSSADTTTPYPPLPMVLFWRRSHTAVTTRHDTTRPHPNKREVD